MSGALPNPTVAAVLPCYKSSAQVLQVLEKVPDCIDAIYCVDDGCPENTGKIIEEQNKDKRVRVLYHEKNQGIGGAMITGYKQALRDKRDIIVKIDSDGQMDPSIARRFINPVLKGQADYTKGNRFYHPEFLEGMPKVRLIGNAGLSFLTKFSTGYWQIFDPTNGYTAIHANVLRLLPLDKISRDYFFEADMLFRLNTVKAVVLDIPQKAIYGDEKSNLKVTNALTSFTIKHIRNFFKRIIYNYFVRDFNVASVEWVLGPALLLFSIIFGIGSWMESVQSGDEATAGTVMLAALPFLVGMQLTLSAMHFDILNQPKTPIHNLIDPEK